MDIQRAQELLRGLADGVNPLTGELLPPDCICNQADLVRAFHTVLAALDAPPKKKLDRPENAGKPWTQADDALLCTLFDQGEGRQAISAQLKRTPGSLAARLVRLGKIQFREEFRSR